MDDITFFEHSRKEETANPSDLLEMKQKLESELHHLEIAKLTGDQVVDDTNADHLTARISELSEELLEESTNVSWKNLLIKRIESNLFSENILKNENSPMDNPFVTSCLQKLELASEIMRIHKDILNLEKSYANEKLINLDLKRDNMSLIQKLKDHEVEVKSVSSEVKKHPDYKKLKAELDVKTMSVEINKNLVTHIVVGAGMNWDADSHLRSIILDEENV